MTNVWLARKSPWPERVWLWVDKRGPDECWPWTGSKDSCGYGVLGKGKEKHKATRVLWLVVHGREPGDLHVLHKCDTPGCVNPAHLSLGTRSDNMRDMIAKGRGNRASGQRNGGKVVAKVDADAVREIRRAYAAGGVTMTALAERYGVTVSNISCIVLRKSWAWLDSEAA